MLQFQQGKYKIFKLMRNKDRNNLIFKACSIQLKYLMNQKTNVCTILSAFYKNFTINYARENLNVFKLVVLHNDEHELIHDVIFS